jgi:hypothetical protein
MITEEELSEGMVAMKKDLDVNSICLVELIKDENWIEALLILQEINLGLTSALLVSDFIKK